jgi:hypothetical protein
MAGILAPASDFAAREISGSSAPRFVSNVETTFKGAFVLATCATPLEVDSVASKQM